MALRGRPSDRKDPRVGKPQIELRTGRHAWGVRPRDWTPLHKFLREEGALTDDEADAFYQAFGECVENVIQHAYRGKRGDWYALAMRATDKPARAVVVDLGIGIPRSIRTDPFDRARAVIAGGLELVRKAMQLGGIVDDDDDDDDGTSAFGRVLGRLESYDWMCVWLATQGRRTQSGETKRGKGLSELRRAVVEMEVVGALHVLSGRAALTWRPGQEPEAGNLTPLRGTVVCVELGTTKESTPNDGT
jgi:hypothetical protein